jgi:hypothetical protein
MNPHLKNEKSTLPDKFIEKVSNKALTSPTAIANNFNKYFINVGPELARQIRIENNEKSFDRYLLFVEPVTEIEVKIEIDKLNQNKSAGYDELSAKVIKLIGNEICRSLAHIFNLTFTTGIIPDSLKIALVTPVYKANEDFRFQNYRSISVLSCFSKLLEKVMYQRLIKFIDANEILSKHQYGFRKNRSTEHAIIEITDKISKAIDEGKYTIGIFLDLSKAFDTVNHVKFL